MKVTEHMIRKVLMETDVQWEEDARAALEVVLKDVPDVEPFTDTAARGRHAFIHPPCWTVVDADPAMKGIEGSIWTDIEAGECDCENTSPWLRIYVEKREA